MRRQRLSSSHRVGAASQNIGLAGVPCLTVRDRTVKVGTRERDCFRSIDSTALCFSLFGCMILSEKSANFSGSCSSSVAPARSGHARQEPQRISLNTRHRYGLMRWRQDGRPLAAGLPQKEHRSRRGQRRTGHVAARIRELIPITLRSSCSRSRRCSLPAPYDRHVQSTHVVDFASSSSSLNSSSRVIGLSVTWASSRMKSTTLSSKIGARTEAIAPGFLR